MSITPVSLLPRLRKILTKNNYEKYKFFEQVGLRPFVADAGELALERIHSFFITIFGIQRADLLLNHLPQLDIGVGVINYAI